MICASMASDLHDGQAVIFQAGILICKSARLCLVQVEGWTFAWGLNYNWWQHSPSFSWGLCCGLCEQGSSFARVPGHFHEGGAVIWYKISPSSACVPGCHWYKFGHHLYEGQAKTGAQMYLFWMKVLLWFVQVWSLDCCKQGPLFTCGPGCGWQKLSPSFSWRTGIFIRSGLWWWKLGPSFEWGADCGWCKLGLSFDWGHCSDCCKQGLSFE
jgi:hypothetical protein